MGKRWSVVVRAGSCLRRNDGKGARVPACAGMAERGRAGSCLRRNDGRGLRNDGGGGAGITEVGATLAAAR